MKDVNSRYAEVAKRLGWKFGKDNEMHELRLEYTAKGGIPYYTHILENDMPYGEQAQDVYDNFFAVDLALDYYETQSDGLEDALKDYRETERSLYNVAVAWSVLDEAIANEQKQTEAPRAEYTEHEKQLISGALIAQIGNISKAIETCANTANNELIDALNKHLGELQRLNTKVCNYLDECR